MTIRIDEARRKLEKLNEEIESVLKSIGDNCDDIEYDSNDLDDAYLFTQFQYLTKYLVNANSLMDYLSKPIIEQGFLKHNQHKRYELPSGNYLTSGSECEILYTDEDEQEWLYTIIDHNGEDYYAFALGENVSLNGMMARIRG